MTPAGEQRVDDFFRRVERIRIEDLAGLAGARPTSDERRQLEEAARRTGKADEVARLRDLAEEYVRKATAGFGPVGPMGLPIGMQVLSTVDMARLIDRLSIASAAMLLGDDLDDETVGALVGPFGALARD